MRMFHGLRHNSRGITVVEVVVIAALLGMTFLLMAPRLSLILRPNYALQECMLLKETLENLLQRSGQTGLSYIFIIDMDNNAAWAVQAENAPLLKSRFPQNNALAIENINETSLRFGPAFKFLDVEYADTVKFENGLAPIRFVNGTNEHVLLHILCDDETVTMWVQPFIAQVHVFEGYLNFDDIYYQH